MLENAEIKTNTRTKCRGVYKTLSSLKMERFAKIVKPLTIFKKCSILDVCQGSEYASEMGYFT